jgi:hypothetical protein
MLKEERPGLYEDENHDRLSTFTMTRRRRAMKSTKLAPRRGSRGKQRETRGLKIKKQSL